MWTRRHTSKIAKMLRDYRANEDMPEVWWLRMILDWAEYFAKQIDEFDRDVFIKACGYPEFSGKPQNK